MILFVNVLVTDSRIMGFRYDRYGLPGANRLDIFKYSLASLAALNKHWSKVVIYCELDGHYAQRWVELEAFVENLFPGIRVKLYKRRNVWQSQWQDAYLKDIAPVRDNLIWYHGNDDHVFIDYDLSCIDAILEQMYTDPTPFVTCMYSHWPEYIRFSAENRSWNCGPASVFTSHNTDAIHIVSKELFRHWFFDFTWHGLVTRTDFIKFAAKIYMKCYVPHRELVRHFDGYSHSMHLPSVCPPLHIPTGFFKHNIKILYCGTSHRDGWTLVNPVMPYRTVQHGGADYRFRLSEIPLFWRSRISEIQTINKYPERMICDARNIEKLVIFDSGVLFARRHMPVIPIDWTVPWIIKEPPQPKLL